MLNNIAKDKLIMYLIIPLDLNFLKANSKPILKYQKKNKPHMIISVSKNGSLNFGR